MTVTPEQRERLRKQRLWEAHLAKVAAEDAAKPKPKPKKRKPPATTDERRREYRREYQRRWKAEHREQERERHREYQRKRAAAMTPEEREAKNARVRARYHERMQNDPEFVARRRALANARYAKKKEASNGQEG